MNFKKFFLYVFFCFSVLLSAAEIPFAERMEGIEPAVQEHLLAVLDEFPRTETGRFVLEHISPDIRFQTQTMAQFGKTGESNVITLESLRLNSKNLPEKTDRQFKSKACFTAEILAHELLHNAQMRAGLFRYPDSFSGYAGVLCEKLLELQAKYTGEKMFFEMQALPEYKDVVTQKAGLFLVTLKQGKDPAKDYALALWGNLRTLPSGAPLYREQIREITQWNRMYAEQAFRNNYVRFAAKLHTPEKEIAARLQQIILFTGMPLEAEELLRSAPVKEIPDGIACYEGEQKVLEFSVIPGGYVKRTFAGTAVNEVKVSIGEGPSK